MAKLVLKSRHRVMCGDSTIEEEVEKLTAGDSASFVFTSPPYAQQRDYGAAKDKIGDWDALMQGVFAAAPVTEDAQILVNLGLVHSSGEWVPYWDRWIEWMRSSGWRRFGFYVWDQGPGLPGEWSGRPAPSHEFIFHFNKVARKLNKCVESKFGGQLVGKGGGLRSKDGTIPKKSNAGTISATHKVNDSVFRVMRHKGKVSGGAHPAVFPVALVEEILDAFTSEGDLLYEPFCGSGTQIIAAEHLGRRCFAMELDPVYVDLVCRRFAIYTGQEPIHYATSKTFSEARDG